MTRKLSPLVVLLAVLGFACGPTNLGGDQNEGGPGHGDGGGGQLDVGGLDGGQQQHDAAHPLEDASERPDNCAANTCPNPVEDNCLSAEICGNGLDDETAERLPAAL